VTQSLAELQFGVQHPLQILVVEPLFEEANRCRRMIAQFMRALEARGIGSSIAALPGCGESLIDISDVGLDDWRAAVAASALSLKPDALATFRGGALLTGTLDLPLWRFAPETGARIARDLERTRLAGSSDLYAGHRLSGVFLEALKSAEIPSNEVARTVRLDSDAGEADAKIPGTPLWRRAEPDENPTLSRALADDLATWLKTCARP
jgi:hypothetical protein